jgi:hypothetical protein
MDWTKIVMTLTAAPGVIALVGAAIGYGQLKQRLVEVEKDTAKIADYGEQLARIDERTRNTDSAVRDMRGDVARLVETLVTDPAVRFRQDRLQRS